MPLERNYQPKLIKKLKRMFPGCYIMKMDTSYMQGIPDLLILWRTHWALLEVKRRKPTSSEDFEPNQEWYIEEFDSMSFSACIYPENEEEVLHALQQTFQPRR